MNREAKLIWQNKKLIKDLQYRLLPKERRKGGETKKIMNHVKKFLGLLWLLLGPAVVFFLAYGAIENIDPAGKKDINNPVIWVIIISIFTPIAIGLMIFGWYALKDEFAHLPESSAEITE